jgi:hypothetical protein
MFMITGISGSGGVQPQPAARSRDSESGVVGVRVGVSEAVSVCV